MIRDALPFVIIVVVFVLMIRSALQQMRIDQRILEGLLLGALCDGEGSALDLADRISATCDLVVGPGRLCPALRALEARRKISSREGDPLPERGNRPRRYYRLAGR